MEGRYPKGIRLVMTNCKDTSREADFNRWYDTVHVPDILASGLASYARRYRNVSLEGTREANYLAIYEIERDDVETIPGKVSKLVEQLTQQGRMHPSLELVSATMWQRIGQEIRSPKTGKAPITGIWLVQTNCTDPAREVEYNAWYNGTHVHDILGTGLYHTAYRFQIVSPQPGHGKFMAIYETDAPDPLQAYQEFGRLHRPRLIGSGRYIDVMEIVRRETFRRL